MLTRISHSPLAGPEKSAIAWLLPKLPAWVTPDRLTALGTAGALIALCGYVLAWRSVNFLWLASFGLFLHWFGDSLDGSLARFRRIERPRYGFFLDQCVDVLGNFLICLGMGLSPFMHLATALLALTGYHALTIYALIRACLDGVFHVTVLNSGPTEMRAMIVLTNTLVIIFGAPEFAFAGVSLTWCDLSVSLFAAGFFAAFLYLSICDARRYLAQDGK